MLVVDAITICLYDRMNSLEISTIETYKTRLSLFCKSLPNYLQLENFGVHHIHSHLACVAEVNKWSTLNNTFMAIRIFCNWLKENDLIEVNWFTDPSYRLKTPKKPKKPRKPIDIKSLKQIIETAFLESNLDTYSGRTAMRDATCMSLMLSTGARRGEVINIKMDDLEIDQDNEQVKIKLLGKGNKIRHVYAMGQAYDTLMTWINLRPHDGDYLFTALGQKFRKNEPMVPYSINIRMRYWCEQAGTKQFSPHDFRRAFITNAINKGINMAQLQLIVGHAHISTTAIYYLPDEDDLRKAIEVINSDL